MWIFHQKLKATSKDLSIWSKEQFGHIFQKPKEFEQEVREAKNKWISTNDPAGKTLLYELKAQYVKFLKTEKAVLKQKIQL